ncbi:MAG: MerR family transcriptional regulator, partial [Clostridiales Family XIII bacterium]|nr:MerR family transcriptional regulator [Clostridiales Family XIII bacterium]
MLRGKRKYNIGEISKISRLSIKALRYYDDKKILVPSERDANTQYRYYSEEQILTALAIHEMQTRGFSLNEVRKVLGAHSLDSITEQYNRHMEEIRAEIAELERKLSLAETSRNLILRAVDYTKDQLEDDPMRNTGRRITVSR